MTIISIIYVTYCLPHTPWCLLIRIIWYTNFAQQSFRQNITKEIVFTIVKMSTGGFSNAVMKSEVSQAFLRKTFSMNKSRNLSNRIALFRNRYSLRYQWLNYLMRNCEKHWKLVSQKTCMRFISIRMYT